MCHNLLKLSDFVNLNLSKELAVSVALLESLVCNLLENKNLVSPASVIKYRRLNDCTLDVRSSDLHLALVVNEKHLVELNSSTFGLRKSLDKDLGASLYFELLACDVYDCVHLIKLFKVSTVSVRSPNGSFSMAYRSCQ